MAVDEDKLLGAEQAQTVEETSTRKKPVKEPGEAFALFYFFWIGGVCWCSWNGFLSSLEYFKSKFGEGAAFIFPLSIYAASFLVAIIIPRLSDKISYNTRVVSSLLILLTIDVILPFEAEIYQKTSFGMGLILVILFVLGFFTNLCLSSISGLANQLDRNFTAYFLIGGAVFALWMNLSKIFISYILKKPHKEAMIPVVIYFGMIEFLILLTLIFHYIFMKSDFARVNFEQRRRSIWEDELEVPIMQTTQPGKQRNFYTMVQVFRQTWFVMVLIIISYTQQNIGYPALMLKKPIPSLDVQDKNIYMITTLSVALIVGKKLGQYRDYYSKKTVVGVVFIRFFLIVAFVIQAITNTVPVLNQVWFGFFNIAIHGFTIGFNNVALFILAPEDVAEDDKEIVGFLSVVIMNAGNMIGSFIAFPLKDVGYQKNEF